MSSQVYKIYQLADEKNTKLVDAFGKYVNLTIIVVLAPPILTPICHAIFNAPSPNQWQLPLPMKYYENIFLSYFYFELEVKLIFLDLKKPLIFHMFLQFIL